MSIIIWREVGMCKNDCDMPPPSHTKMHVYTKGNKWLKVDFQFSSGHFCNKEYYLDYSGFTCIYLSGLSWFVILEVGMCDNDSDMPPPSHTKMNIYTKRNKWLKKHVSSVTFYLTLCKLHTRWIVHFCNLNS